MKEERVKRLYNVPEAAVYLGKTPHAIRDMVYKGKLPCIHEGRRVLLDIHDMDKWIDQNREQRPAY